MTIRWKTRIMRYTETHPAVHLHFVLKVLNCCGGSSPQIKDKGFRKPVSRKIIKGIPAIGQLPFVPVDVTN